MTRKPWSKHQRPGNRRFPAAVRRLILKRDRICQIGLPGCTETPEEADHVIGWNEALLRGWTRGEYDHPSNGQAVCRNCHKAKTAHQAAQGKKLASAKRQKDENRRKHPGILE